MNRIRNLLPLVIGFALIWWACDGRTVTQSVGDNQQVSSVEVSVHESILYYSQSTRTAVQDTISILVLDENRSAMADIPVTCEIQSSFGGGLTPLTNRMTNSNGVAQYLFRVLPSDQAFTGDQTVTFRATAGSKVGTSSLTLIEQSEIQLVFLSPANGSTMHRMFESSATMPVRLKAFRTVMTNDVMIEEAIPGLNLRFSVYAIGDGLAGSISAAGVTGSDGITQAVYYSNHVAASETSSDTLQVQFTAAVVGGTESATSTVDLVNNYGLFLQRMQPQTLNLRSDLLCTQNTHFVYQLRDASGNVYSGRRFDISASFGELSDNVLVSSSNGLIEFDWINCAAEGGELVLDLLGESGLSYVYTYPVADARGIALDFISPVAGDTISIDPDCDVETGAIPVRVRMRYTDNQLALVGKTLEFAASHGQITASVVTDASGIAQASWINCNPGDAMQSLTLTAAFTRGEESPVVSAQTERVMSVPENVAFLQRVLPALDTLRSSLICSDSTRFRFHYRDGDFNPIAGARFDLNATLGSLSTYVVNTDENGAIEFNWRNCTMTGGELVLTLSGSEGLNYTFTHPVLDARPIELTIISPAAGSELEVDSECIEENQVPIRARLRYGDNNNPIVGQAIHFSANLGEIGSTALTDANGISAVMWHDCDESDNGEDLDITAAFYGQSSQPLLVDTRQYEVTIPLGVPHHINVSALNPILPAPADGSLQSDVTATVFNSQNQRLGANLAIGFKTNGIGDITAASFTDENGQADAVFIMNNQTGIAQILAYYVKPGTTPPDTLWSTPGTVTVNSGVPANVTMNTPSPRIQIIGFGSASTAQVTARVVDAQGGTVTNNVQVRFTIENGPDNVYLSSPGQTNEYFEGDTLNTTSQNGLARMTINSGNRPGPVQIGCFVQGDTYNVYSSRSLVTILAGPPAYGTISYDGTGVAEGAGIWRVRWSVHLWDQYSNDVEDSTSVWFFLNPSNVCSMEGFGLTGVTADGEEGIPGVAEDWMTYHCTNIGDTLWNVIARSNGVVPEVGPFGDTTWVDGVISIPLIPNQTVPPSVPWQVPFQAGDRDDNLTVVGQFSQIVFPMGNCTNPNNPPHFEQDMAVQATLVDGYGCPVANQPILFQSDIGGVFDPEIVITNEQGVAQTTLTCTSTVLQNLGQACVTDEDCWAYASYTLNYQCFRLPDANPISNAANVVLSRPCN